MAPTLTLGDAVVMDNLEDEALAQVIDTVTAPDAKGCFTHCGEAFH